MGKLGSPIRLVATRPNDHAWFSMGFAVASVLMIMVALSLASAAGHPGDIGSALGLMTRSGFVYASVALALALAGTYYGVRGHNAAVRGFATNGAMARTWGAVASVAALIWLANAVVTVVLSLLI